MTLKVEKNAVYLIAIIKVQKKITCICISIVNIIVLCSLYSTFHTKCDPLRRVLFSAHGIRCLSLIVQLSDTYTYDTEQQVRSLVDLNDCCSGIISAVAAADVRRIQLSSIVRVTDCLLRSQLYLQSYKNNHYTYTPKTHCNVCNGVMGQY